MIKKGYVFPYDINDSFPYGARWEDNILSITFFVGCKNKPTPNEIEVKFHGVDWIRSTTYIKYPCTEEEWDFGGYKEEKPIDNYLLIDRNTFNDNYEDFMTGNYSDPYGIRALEDNVLFIDDLIVFSCSEIEIVRAVYKRNIMARARNFFKKFNRKYKRQK